MEKFIEIININWVHQAIGIGVFLLGVMLGAITVAIIWKKFAFREKEQDKTPKDVSYITQNAISAYDNGNSSLDMSKLGYLCEALTYLLEKIPAEYGNTKAYKIISKENLKINGKEVLASDLSLKLDFTVYEILGFINCLAEQIRGEIYSILNSKAVKVIGGIGKIALKNKMQADDRHKDLDDITIESLRRTISLLTKKEETEEKRENKIASFFKPLVDKVKGLALDIANPRVDVYAREIIEIFAIELNKLYSGQLKEKTVRSLSQISLEEVV